MTAPSLLHESIFFCTPSRILFGAGVLAQLPALLQRMGWRRALIVTDGFFAAHGRPGFLLRQCLIDHGIDCDLFDGGVPDPGLALCDAATRAMREGIIPDCVIALGGGSNIDLAKVLTLTLVNGAEAASYVGLDRLPHDPLPLVAIPTTSGTASELTPGAILVAKDGQTKVAVMDNALRARIAVIDPTLTLSCPPRVTADAGVDALTHAIESYITQDAADYDRGGHPDPAYSGRNILTRTFARESIRLCFEHLRTAYREPDNLEARTGMALASLYAGLSYGNAGLHGVHALAYGVAALTHETHGTTNAVMLPYVMAGLAEDRCADLCEIARIAGVHGGSGDTSEGAIAAARFVKQLIADVGVATDLRSLGLAEQDLPGLAAAGVGVQRLTKAYPASDPVGHYSAIVRAAHAGTLS